MAQVTHARSATAFVPPNVSEWIDSFLPYLMGEWQALPETEAEWDDWDEMSKLTFVIDWGVPADRLHSLQQWAELGLMTAEQRQRYGELLALVERHQPILNRLLAE